MYTFKEKSIGYHHNQVDMVLSIYEEDTLLGTLEYSILDNIPYISMIQVKPEYRNKGIGKQLLYKLVEEYDYKDIQWGMMTEDGYRLQQSLDKEFKIDRASLENKNLPTTILDDLKKKDKTLYEFAMDLYTYGNTKAWNIWANESYTKENYEVMKNISDIVEWIYDSKSNEHDTKENPPYYIFDILKELKIFKKEYIKEQKKVIDNNYVIYKEEGIMDNSKKVFLKEGQIIVDSNGEKFEIEEGDYIPLQESTEFSNEEPYADKYFASEIVDFIRKNKDSKYPLSIQVKGEHGQTKWLGISSYDLVSWLDALGL
jgi:GNAT superfamily N-acetyltransferase